MDTQKKSSITISLSKAYEIEIVKGLLVFLLGSFAIIIHAKLRIPLGIPGRHGIIFMALLFLGKYMYNSKFSGSLFSLGCNSILIFSNMGFNDPYMPVIIMFPGLITDILPMVFKTKNAKLGFTILVGAIAYMSIPTLRTIIMSLTGFPYGSLLKSPILPFITYFLFGALGTAFAFGVNHAIKKRKIVKQ